MNNKAIEAALPGAIIWDDKIKGLHLRAFDAKKVYYLYYRTKAGKQRRPKIGYHGTITLTRAREIAKDWLETVAAGGDPAIQQEERREAITVKALTERYLKHVRTDPKDKKKPKSIEEDESQIANYILPWLGKKLAIDVTGDDIENLHGDMAKVPIRANRTLALLSRMFNLAEKWKVRQKHTNPCTHVSRYPERKRRRHMTGEEAPAVAALLAKYEKEYPAQALFLHLLILTGARPDEIRRGTRAMVKGNRLVHKEHKTDGDVEERVIYLPPRVLTLIDKVPTKDGSLTGIKSPRHLWTKIRKESGCLDLTMYDLRRTFASAALRAGYTLDQIGELLGHTSGTTTKRYAWLMDEVRSDMATGTADVLEKMMALKVPAE